MAKNLETATLGGGCFWCTDAVFDELRGVESVVSGYTGGHVPNPSYEAVCSKTTGHAEVTQVTYDADVISLEELLRIFFTTHDPTTLNRQGNDIGPQYRSAVFYHNEEQKTRTEAIIAEFEALQLWPSPIVTEVTPLDIFYAAEAYHQDYYKRNPYAGYCMFVIRPKVGKLRKQYFQALKK
ncbi:MAG: peptide-methionine (S)-S-oxide reductase MsrA [Candidatus Promineifilaceae bacterium]